MDTFPTSCVQFRAQSAQHMRARDDRRVRPLVERHVGARRRVAHEDARHFVWVEALVPQRGCARLEGDGREYLNLGSGSSGRSAAGEVAGAALWRTSEASRSTRTKRGCA